MARMTYQNIVAEGIYDGENNSFVIQRMIQGKMDQFHKRTIVKIDTDDNQHFQRFIYQMNGATVYFLSLHEMEEMSEAEKDEATSES